MSRKRIVIELDAPAAAGSATARSPVNRARKSRRWPRVAGALFALVLIGVGAVALGGYFWWRSYQSTPAYALSLIIDAAQRGDVPEFQKRLDDEQIARNMVTAVSEKAAARYGIALSNTVKRQIDNTMPSLLQEIKPAIHEEIAKEINAFAATSNPRPFVLLVIAVPSLMTITTEGDQVKASATLNDRRFELAMRRGDGGWKVIEFKDDVVVQRVVDRVMTQLPAIGQLDPSLPILKPSKRRSRPR